MNPSLQHILESKYALRRELAALPVAEKLRMLDAMRGGKPRSGRAPREQERSAGPNHRILHRDDWRPFTEQRAPR